ncbi:MAG: LysM peptidoglycan-binding domain-containing protein, partial [Holosporaceae bacterium]|nr:LysM peptidoglycan-binding domain-containing protein [Holosporaceae bacterium]
MARFTYIFCVLCMVLLSGCGRSELSPVELKIDNASVNRPIVSGESVHVVSGEESLFEVAYRHNVDPMNLAKINNIKAPYRVKRGQILRLPTDNPAETATANAAITVDTEDKNIRSYEEDENKKPPEIEKDAVMEEFEKMLDAETPESKKQAQELSKPKI